jgi:hypothetical protein
LFFGYLYDMTDKPLKSCSKTSCNECEIHSRLNCQFYPDQLFRFYLIVLPSFILGTIGVRNYSTYSLISWVLFIAIFFLFLGIRVLCTHCPHYNESSGIIRCWVNYGVPKLWKYRPSPMNIYEKAILICGFCIIWGYPVIFISLTNKWILLGGYILSVISFFFLFNRFACRRCINFSCPLNRVSLEVKEEFFRNNK